MRTAVYTHICFYLSVLRYSMLGVGGRGLIWWHGVSTEWEGRLCCVLSLLYLDSHVNYPCCV